MLITCYCTPSLHFNTYPFFSIYRCTCPDISPTLRHPFTSLHFTSILPHFHPICIYIDAFPYISHVQWYNKSCDSAFNLWMDGSIVGKEFLPYVGPHPMIGIHRYVLVLFQQKAPMGLVEEPTPRPNFSTRAFANQFELGLPVTTIYFNSQKEPNINRRRWEISLLLLLEIKLLHLCRLFYYVFDFLII